jgi:hypothetical protein
MSPISLSLDVLLMVLLVAALGFGWRLERRLKSLRESHADFAKAVGDLDRAAMRAETGLAQLRQATDEAVDLLAGRIEKARELTAKLDRLTGEAATVAENAPRPRPVGSDAQRAASERPVARQAPVRQVQQAPAGRSSPTDAVLAAERLARRLSSDDSLVLRAPAAQPAQRSRPLDDDELFEAPPRALADGRRTRW